MNLPPDKFDIDGFSQGLVEAAHRHLTSELSVLMPKAATRTSAWVITGGTASGVMDIVGKACANERTYSRGRAWSSISS